MADYAKVSDLPLATSIANADVLELQQDDGIGGYVSKKILSSNFFGSSNKGAIGVSVNGGASVITPGLKGYVIIPYRCTITGWYIVASPSGTIVFDVWKASGTVPTVLNTITGDQKPTVSSGQVASSTVLEHWTISVAEGDIMAFNVDSASTITQATLTLGVIKR